jgi:hypothetical protein
MPLLHMQLMPLLMTNIINSMEMSITQRHTILPLLITQLTIMSLYYTIQQQAITL